MKPSLRLFIVISFSAFMTSCIKFSFPIPHPPGKNDSTATTVPMDSVTRALTGQTWVYSEYFMQWSVTSPYTSYLWYDTVNASDLSRYQIKFNPDSTYTQTDSLGAVSQGTWSFLNNETQVKMVSNSGTFIQQISAIVPDRYEWLDSLDNYGVMAPRRQAGAAVDTIALITAKTWVYRESVTSTNTTTSRLSYRMGRSTNKVNMATFTLKLDANGTFTEVSQNGINISGSWQKSIYRGQTCFTLSSTSLPITLTYTIQLLDAGHLECMDYTNKLFSALVTQ